MTHARSGPTRFADRWIDDVLAPIVVHGVHADVGDDCRVELQRRCSRAATARDRRPRAASWRRNRRRCQRSRSRMADRSASPRPASTVRAIRGVRYSVASWTRRRSLRSPALGRPRRRLGDRRLTSDHEPQLGSQSLLSSSGSERHGHEPLIRMSGESGSRRLRTGSAATRVGEGKSVARAASSIVMGWHGPRSPRGRSATGSASQMDGGMSARFAAAEEARDESARRSDRAHRCHVRHPGPKAVSSPSAATVKRPSSPSSTGLRDLSCSTAADQSAAGDASSVDRDVGHAKERAEVAKPEMIDRSRSSENVARFELANAGAIGRNDFNSKITTAHWRSPRCPPDATMVQRWCQYRVNGPVSTTVGPSTRGGSTGRPSTGVSHASSRRTGERHERLDGLVPRVEREIERAPVDGKT